MDFSIGKIILHSLYPPNFAPNPYSSCKFHHGPFTLEKIAAGPSVFEK
jgi:hypothetical protein